MQYVMDQTTLAGILLAGITALGGVVTVLWKQISSNQQRTEKKLDECEQDREELHQKIGGLTVRVDELEGHRA
jgi:outer membrane murein-binding lipoprotein Lpp